MSGMYVCKVLMNTKDSYAIIICKFRLHLDFEGIFSSIF